MAFSIAARLRLGAPVVPDDRRRERFGRHRRSGRSFRRCSRPRSPRQVGRRARRRPRPASRRTAAKIASGSYSPPRLERSVVGVGRAAAASLRPRGSNAMARTDDVPTSMPISAGPSILRRRIFRSDWSAPLTASPGSRGNAMDGVTRRCPASATDQTRAFRLRAIRHLDNIVSNFGERLAPSADREDKRIGRNSNGQEDNSLLRLRCRGADGRRVRRVTRRRRSRSAFCRASSIRSIR